MWMIRMFLHKKKKKKKKFNTCVALNIFKTSRNNPITPFFFSFSFFFLREKSYYLLESDLGIRQIEKINVN